MLLPACIRRSLPLAAALCGATAAAHDGEFLEPPDGAVYSGIGNTQADADEFSAASGMDLLMHKLYLKFDAVAVHKLNPMGLLKRLTSIAAVGQVPQLALDFRGFDASYLPLDHAVALGYHDDYLDQLAATIRTFGKPMFLVPGYEFNQTGYTPGIYPQAYRRIVERFRAAGADNVAWIWTPLIEGSTGDFTAKDANGNWLWWPGEHYVNWIGANTFVAAAWDKAGVNATAKAMVKLLSFADQYAKPVTFCETTSVLGVDILPTSHPSAALQAQQLWSQHFALLFGFLENQPRVKGFVYISTDWEQTNFTGWGNARVQDNAYLLDAFVDRLSGGPYLHAQYTPAQPWVPHLLRKVPAGGSVEFAVDNLPPGAPAALFIGAGLQPGIDVAGISGKFRLAAPIIHVTTVTAGEDGRARFQADLPAGSSLSGQTLESQWVTLQGLPKPMRVVIQ